MTNKEEKAIKYFRNNIFESFDSYSAWKMIFHVRSKEILSEEMAKRYVSIQEKYPCFFVSTERAHLIRFVTLSCHSFDKRRDSFSLHDLDRQKTDKFFEENDAVIKALKKVRDEIFAHGSKGGDGKYEIPSIVDLDAFFKSLCEFYNSLTSEKEDSITLFDGVKDMKRDLENIYINLERGENVRLKEVDIKWFWEVNPKKGSDLL